MKPTIDHKPIKPGGFGRSPTKIACFECPLRRKSTPGYLGGYTTEQYLDILHGIADIACHQSPGFPENHAETRSCTGVAKYRANVGITRLAHNAAAAVAHVGPDREEVFASPEEFFKHHQINSEGRR
jgi:hypothetical protein